MLTTSSSDDDDDEIFNLSNKKRPLRQLVTRKAPPKEVSARPTDEEISSKLPIFDSDLESESEEDNVEEENTGMAGGSEEAHDVDRSPTPPPVAYSLAPEVIALRNQLASDGLENWTSANSDHNSSSSSSHSTSTSTTQAPFAPPNIEVIVNVHIHNHSPSRVKFLINDKDTFEMILQLLAQTSYNCEPGSIMLAYREVEISTFTTPASISSDKVLTIDAYFRIHFEKLQREKKEEHAKRLLDLTQEEEVVEEPPPVAPSSIHVKLKDKDGEPLKLKVHATTTVAHLIESFAKSRGLSPAKLKLHFDGSMLSADSLVSDLDVEDGDLLEVRHAAK
ncbi:hypothetical protein HDU67_007124 [Dinochytrium kinnereticum]|nr:hypothetical protein HDU67_007124 [Dinochytrium kinnereticum]